MRVRLQYFLLILLFVTAGMLCRHRFVAPAVAATHDNCPVLVSDTGCDAFFSQTQPMRHDMTGRYLARTMFAPELTCAVTPENPDQKSPVRNTISPRYSVCAKQIVPRTVRKRDVGLDPRPADYYIFQLGKILI